MDPKTLKRLIADLKPARQLHEQVWSDCYRMTLPERGNLLLQDIQTAGDVQQQKARIYDSTGPDSVRVGVSTLMGAMLPASSIWFGIDVGTTSTEEQDWLDDFAKTIWENIHAGNFDSEAFDALLDAWIAGYFLLYCDEAEGGGYRFETWPVGECYIASSTQGGKIDTVARCFELSVMQTVNAYGIDNVSQRVRSLYSESKYHDKVRITHYIAPREQYKSGKRAKDLPYLSCHIEDGQDRLLREGGYHEMPVIVPRWTRLPNSHYATGPVSAALPDILTLNEAKKWTLLAAEMANTPPLVATDDGVLNPRNIKIGPRKVIVANDVDSIKPLITGANVQMGLITVEGLQASVRKVLMADHVPPADGPTKTAYEWSVRVQSIRQAMGPIFGRFQSEFLQPLIERCFGILWRANEATGYALAPKPPQTLINRSFTVRYLSPLARAQRMQEVEAMDRFEMTLAQGMQIEPSLVDLYDWDAAYRERGKALSLPSNVLFSEREVTARRQAKAQQAEQMQAQQQQQALQAQGQAQAQEAMINNMTMQ